MMQSSSDFNLRQSALPLLVLLLFGSALGSASVETMKLLGFDPFGANKVATTARPAPIRGAAARRPALLAANSYACSCGAVQARRSPLLPTHVMAQRAEIVSEADCITVTNSLVDVPSGIVAIDPALFLEPQSLASIFSVGTAVKLTGGYVDGMPLVANLGVIGGVSFGSADRFGGISSLPATETTGDSSGTGATGITSSAGTSGSADPAASTATLSAPTSGNGSTPGSSATPGNTLSAPTVTTTGDSSVVHPVPEPTSLALLAITLLGVAVMGRRRA